MTEEAKEAADAAKTEGGETAKPTKAAKPKKEKVAKEPKPEPVRNWDEGCQDAGRRVFTARGPGFVIAADDQAGRFLVELERDQKEHDMAQSGVRFKAFNDDYREKYEVDKSVRTPSGSPSVNCGDLIARSLKGLTDPELKGVAKENGVEDKWASWEERNLNPGMKRMNLGNVLRARFDKEGKLKEGKTCTITGLTLQKAAEVRDRENAKIAEEAEKKAKSEAAAKKAAKDAKPKKAPKAKAKA